MGDARVTYSVIFQGDHGTAAASSTTKRYGPGQRARYLKHILDSQSKILATDSNTQVWLWKRYLKMAARAMARAIPRACATRAPKTCGPISPEGQHKPSRL